jgi:hypothetical protein
MLLECLEQRLDPAQILRRMTLSLGRLDVLNCSPDVLKLGGFKSVPMLDRY